MKTMKRRSVHAGVFMLAAVLCTTLLWATNCERSPSAMVDSEAAMSKIESNIRYANEWCQWQLGLRKCEPGGNQADFDELIKLITSTVKPESWDENGGAGTLRLGGGQVQVFDMSDANPSNR